MHAPNGKKCITQIISILPSVKLENLMHCYKHLCIIHKCMSPASFNPYLFFTIDFLIHHIVCTIQFLIHHVCTKHNFFSPASFYYTMYAPPTIFTNQFIIHFVRCTQICYAFCNPPCSMHQSAFNTPCTLHP